MCSWFLLVTLNVTNPHFCLISPYVWIVASLLPVLSLFPACASLHSWAGLSTTWRHLIVLPTMQLWEISLWERKTVTGRKVRPRGREAGTEKTFWKEQKSKDLTIFLKFSDWERYEGSWNVYAALFLGGLGTIRKSKRDVKLRKTPRTLFQNPFSAESWIFVFPRFKFNKLPAHRSSV